MLDAPQDTPRLPLRLLEAFSGVYARNCLQNRVHLRTTRGPKPASAEQETTVAASTDKQLRYGYKAPTTNTICLYQPVVELFLGSPTSAVQSPPSYFVLSSSRHPISPSSPSGGPLIAQTKLVRFKQRPRRFRTPPLLGLSF
ncbi:hypothetical protein DTO166G4_3171 [Paecilomyces variotii]|nr:hypothetical protein DTO166G4_3171 [Paecilomyces variotii]KAJ9233823.1 hypothetical protein DTO166G5_5484 [Paecilomyces variotii]KAJ9270888.1 hypothetical protein DTO212C5_3113 [Paecilomyces variotii]